MLCKRLLIIPMLVGCTQITGQTQTSLGQGPARVTAMANNEIAEQGVSVQEETAEEPGTAPTTELGVPELGAPELAAPELIAPQAEIPQTEGYQEEPAQEQPLVEQSLPEQPLEEAVEEQPFTEQSLVEQPQLAEQPPTAQFEQPPAEQPLAEAPPVEASSAEAAADENAPSENGPNENAQSENVEMSQDENPDAEDAVEEVQQEEATPQASSSEESAAEESEESFSQGIDEGTRLTKSDVDINRKSAECKRLTNNAVKHFMKVSIENACNDFIHNSIWRKGELFVFVINAEGVILAHGDDYDLIWNNISKLKGVGGTPLLKNFLTIGQKGGRVSYLWDHSFKVSYVKTVIKSGKRYLLGCGFFPENDEYQTKQLVKTAVAFFKQNGPEATFALISNPKGPFVKGDIYSFAVDFNGEYVAHGQNFALVGQNLIDLTDSRGKPIIRDLIAIAKTKGKGWLDYEWRNEFKRGYVERVVDPKTKKPYLISAGYYPNVNLQVVKSYVNRALSYLKTNGAKAAFAEFSNLVGEFAKGGLGIFVYDYKGKNLANGENPAFVGQNLIKMQAQGGKYYVRDMIRAARKYGKALINYRNFNAHAIAYVENVETPDGKFVIGAEFFPESKQASTLALVNEAVDYIRTHKPAQAFDEFSNRSENFLRGDLHVFVYKENGTRLVNGPQKAQIWHNFLKTTDQEGKAIINDLVQLALNGGGWTTYKTRNANRKVFVKAVEKKLTGDTIENLIVGSGYFL